MIYTCHSTEKPMFILGKRQVQKNIFKKVYICDLMSIITGRVASVPISSEGVIFLKLIFFS